MFDRKRFREWVRSTGMYAVVLTKWMFLALIVGSLCGVVGAVFHLSVHYAAQTREAYPWLLWCPRGLQCVLGECNHSQNGCT